MRDNPYGPDKPCQRTACAGREAHLGRRHLDQRDELYDGPDILLNAQDAGVRRAARTLIDRAPDLMPEVVDLVKEISRLRDQIAHVQVDAERKRIDALSKMEDCAHHGEVIKEQREQIFGFDKLYQRTDQARVALLELLHRLENTVEAYRQGRTPADLTVDKLMSALADEVKRAKNAHQRQWKK